jgi:hypothetical protein
MITQIAEYSNTKAASDDFLSKLSTLYSTHFCDTIVDIAHKREETIITGKYFFAIYFISGK